MRQSKMNKKLYTNLEVNINKNAVQKQKQETLNKINAVTFLRGKDRIVKYIKI